MAAFIAIQPDPLVDSYKRQLQMESATFDWLMDRAEQKAPDNKGRVDAAQQWFAASAALPHAFVNESAKARYDQQRFPVPLRAIKRIANSSELLAAGMTDCPAADAMRQKGRRMAPRKRLDIEHVRRYALAAEAGWAMKPGRDGFVTGRKFRQTISRAFGVSPKAVDDWRGNGSEAFDTIALTDWDFPLPSELFALMEATGKNYKSNENGRTAMRGASS